MHVRPARDGDAEVLREIETAAGLQFHRVDMARIAEDDPPTVHELEQAALDGRLWVAEDPDAVVVGYARMELLTDGSPHLEQVSVLPDAQGRGVGRALVAAVADRARALGATTLTLTTFRDVDWNRPLYEHLGFVVVPDGELPAALAEVRTHEIAAGLDASGPRVAMCLTLSTAPSGGAGCPRPAT